MPGNPFYQPSSASPGRGGGVTDGIISDAHELYRDSGATPALVTFLFGSNFNPKAISRWTTPAGFVSVLEHVSKTPPGGWRAREEGLEA